MPIPKFLLLMFCSLFSYAASAHLAGETKGPFRAVGSISNISPGEQLEWFGLWNRRMRFVADPKDRDQISRLAKILDAAEEQGRSVHVTYDPSRARFEHSTGKIAYPICSVTLNELHFDSARACGPASLSRKPGSSSPESALALATALADANDPSGAATLLDGILSDKNIDPELFRTALDTRADALSALGKLEPTGSVAGDRYYVRALMDLRKLDVLSPKSINVDLDTAYVLEQLGDYGAANDLYSAIKINTDRADVIVSTRMAALARIRGNAARSLELLNGLVQRRGPQDGMRFHYHRAWTLNELGEFDQAIADLTEGLKWQPDYAWAHLQRACAYGGIGKLDFALSDVEAGIGLIKQYATADDVEAQIGLRNASEIAVALKAKITKGENDPVQFACEGYSNLDGEPRKKSPLLQL